VPVIVTTVEVFEAIILVSIRVPLELKIQIRPPANSLVVKLKPEIVVVFPPELVDIDVPSKDVTIGFLKQVKNEFVPFGKCWKFNCISLDLFTKPVVFDSSPTEIA